MAKSTASTYRTSPADLEGMPPGVPHIIGNEAAERFSFYGMKAVLAIFMVNFLHLMDGPSGPGMSDAEATEQVHLFTFAVYLTPFLGAVLSDAFLGKYRTIMLLSLVYCAGHAALACMGWMGSSPVWLAAGLAMIALGSGGIKPCVSAHVGDQFGSRNSHLLSKVFNGFYFSINLGAFASTLLTPWLLEWYGPHWAFGVPGVLMALATLVFWMGRKRFIHVPAKGWNAFISEVTGSGLKVILKLIPLYLFVAMFWALFDQTASRFIFQAQDMDLQFLGVEWLPSQVQAMNPVFILIFIPLFAFLGYPMLDRLWKLTPLRKIGIGLFLMALSFAMASLVQTSIDGGAQPNIGWQIAVIALLTAAEVMVSIVALEFAYTQAPKTMKSLIMCLYLGSVAVGNLFVAGVNHFIQIPSAAQQQWEQAVDDKGEEEIAKLEELVLPGLDGKLGTEDDILQKLEDGRKDELEIPGHEVFEEVAARIEQLALELGKELPTAEQAIAKGALDGVRDPWGNRIEYTILNSKSARLISAGPDRVSGTQWDVGLVLELEEEEKTKEAKWTDRFHPEEPWLDRWKREIGAKDEEKDDEEATLLDRTQFSGGQSRLPGAIYFWFFTALMLLTAIAFVPYAILYKPRTYLQD